MRTSALLLASLLWVACSGDDDAGGSQQETPQRSPSGPEEGAEAPGVPAEPAPQPAVVVDDAPVRVIAIDTHVDTTQRMLDHGDDIAESLPGGHLDLPRMRAGGLTGAFFSIWVNPRLFRGSLAWRRARGLIGAVTAFVEAHPEVAVLCRTAADVRGAHTTRRAAILMGIEGAHAFGTADPEVLMQRLRWAYDRGVRYLSPTWSVDSPLGHSSTGDSPEEGLTELGRDVVRAMNQMGMVIDVSHVSNQTLSDVLRITTKPVFASHSSARSLADHPRNIPDDLIRQVAAGGGAICVNYFSQYIDVEYRERRRRLENRHRARFEAIRAEHEDDWIARGQAETRLAQELDPAIRPPTLQTLGEHFEHIVRIGGMGAACLGSDFDGIPELPVGLEDVSRLGALRQELEGRHLDIPAIFGGNVLRVLGSQANQ